MTFGRITERPIDPPDYPECDHCGSYLEQHVVGTIGRPRVEYWGCSNDECEMSPGQREDDNPYLEE